MKAWRLLLLAAGAAALAPADLPAQEVNGYVELTATKSRSEGEDVTSQRTTRDTDSFLQRYSLDWQLRPTPGVQVLLGGLFERTDSTADENDTSVEATQRRFRPYLTATLRNAIYNATFGYYRTRDDTFGAGVSQGLIQEIWNTTLGWRPERAPAVTLRLLRTNNFDAGREFQDTTSDLADLTGEFQPIDTVQLYYRGALEDLDDRLQDFTVRRASQSGRITYGDLFWDRRLEVSGEYDVNHIRTEVTTAGGGEFTTILFPLLGLSIISDMPDNVTLAPNGALIDGDRAASAGLNLGLQPLGGDERPRNIGLDLGATVELNTIQVWVDRDLTQPIAGSFAWDIYTSPDNLNWTFERTVFPAAFGPFDRRFEIRFPNLSARYIKVTTPSLGRGVSMASSFPTILVTECIAALRTPAAEARGTTTLTTELLTANVRARITKDPLLFYEMSYFERRTGSLPSTYTISNGFSLAKRFNPVYSVAARLSREDSRENLGDRQSYIYTASLRAAPLQTLQSSVIVSGRSSDIEGRTSDSSSVYLNTSAELYSGITTTLGIGRAETTGESGEQTDTTRINALATLVPHDTTTVNLLYQSTEGTRRGGVGQSRAPVDTSAAQASVAYRPLATLYFFLSYRRETAIRATSRFLRNYAVSWSPLPEGSLQVLLSYDESYQSDLEALTRILSPRVRWNITDRWYAELAYQKSEFDSRVDVRNADALTATTRFWF